MYPNKLISVRYLNFYRLFHNVVLTLYSSLIITAVAGKTAIVTPLIKLISTTPEMVAFIVSPLITNSLAVSLPYILAGKIIVNSFMVKILNKFPKDDDNTDEYSQTPI
jgi:hypothetical protein